MKKLLVAACILSLATATTVFAAETTYTEKFINKHTQKVVNTEKNLTAIQKEQQAKVEAQKKALQKKQEEQKAKAEANKKAVEKKKAENKKKVQQKKDAWKSLTTW